MAIVKDRFAVTDVLPATMKLALTWSLLEAAVILVVRRIGAAYDAVYGVALIPVIPLILMIALQIRAASRSTFGTLLVISYSCLLGVAGVLGVRLMLVFRGSSQDSAYTIVALILVPGILPLLYVLFQRRLARPS